MSKLFKRLRKNLMSEEGMKALANFASAMGDYQKAQDKKKLEEDKPLSQDKSGKLDSKKSKDLFKGKSKNFTMPNDLGSFGSRDYRSTLKNTDKFFGY